MFEEQRDFLKANAWKTFGSIQSDQQKGLAIPPVEKAIPPDAARIDLVPHEQFAIGQMPVREAFERRQSRRKFSTQAFTLEEISYLLWATQGVRESLKDGTITRRTVPSGGSRHPFETYLVIHRVEGMAQGLYRYLPLEHQLVCLRAEDGFASQLADACMRQKFMAEAAVIFCWAAVPYRCEWRYTVASHKVIAIDGGHVCQNLYIAAESIGAGTCAVAAYDQAAVDELLGLDGQDEFVMYLAPAGKIEQQG